MIVTAVTIFLITYAGIAFGRIPVTVLSLLIVIGWVYL